MSFFDKLSLEMDAYLEAHASQESDILKEVSHASHAETTQGHMVSGHQQGVLLGILTAVLKPKLVLEIGTFTGYASIAIAKALQPDAKLITVDTNKNTSAMASFFFEKSKVSSSIEIHEGQGLEYLQMTNLIFDMVFIDADKENYPEYYRQTLPKVRSGGLILIDNTLWYGKVLEANPKKKNTKAVQELNNMIAQDTRVEAVILPLRDGLTIIRKK